MKLIKEVISFYVLFNLLFQLLTSQSLSQRTGFLKKFFFSGGCVVACLYGSGEQYFVTYKMTILIMVIYKFFALITISHASSHVVLWQSNQVMAQFFYKFVSTILFYIGFNALLLKCSQYCCSTIKIVSVFFTNSKYVCKS